MAPGITEIIYALGQDEKLVGVTRYCDYPEDVKNKTRVGGFYDPNYEQILALKPDLVLLVVSHKKAKAELEKLNIDTLMVPNETVPDIYEAIGKIGGVCGAEEKAKALTDKLQARVEAVRTVVKDEDRPRVLICIERDIDSSKLSGLYMAGQNTFYDTIIEVAGGVNAITSDKTAYPQMSAEGIISLNPDVIVDLVGVLKEDDKSKKEIIEQWDKVGVVKAVRNDRVHLIVGYHALRPGPRFVQFVEQLARYLHPALFKMEKDDE
ncbi:MAG: ABC transporter substrate-binding protein [Candidatus Sumerlaeota bacterium]